jgi:hypothetical protein
MRSFLLAALFLTFTACGGGGGDDSSATLDASPGPDAPTLRACDGEAYDLCTDTTNWTDCMDGMECRLFGSAGFTICTPQCDGANPCPPDEDGNPVTCNMMGRCRGTTPNSCMLP